ncbi:uncharacterized protein LOC114312968 isoform X3 [Camellia sinensis]|uniref:uncharacterized protein LOC114312968 isoform X3 n=1 Tax=Camellia sinensis TaxID=4442 RepID=UPI001036BCEE|nr:uncharacterized protein LOC114312968 isoform X3 [Camellia sinensis]
MGIPSTMRDAWANRRNSPLIASPAEDQKVLNSRRCTQDHGLLLNGVSGICRGCSSRSEGSFHCLCWQCCAYYQAQIDLDAKKLQSYVKEKSLMSEKGILADKISPGVLRSLVSLTDKPNVFSFISDERCLRNFQFRTVTN